MATGIFTQSMDLPQLPIQHVLARISQTLEVSSAVITAPPGSGKTTVVPLSLLNEPWLEGKRILILEPRRLAARTAAARMAFLLGEKVGQRVGYQVRLERKISSNTQIEVLTEGVLTRRIQTDPELNGVGLIIFDEFHERSIHADLALALCLDLCLLKEDLRLLVMSATLDAEPVSRLLGGAPIISSEGKSHAVEVEYLKKEQPHKKIIHLTVNALHKVLEQRRGDILIFLPGVGEIKAVRERFERESRTENIVVLTLYGAMPQKLQGQVILPDGLGRRRVILATSIAETSISIEGVDCVIDSGLARRPKFNPGNGLSRLVTQRVSQASANQRTGRAGRFGPGYCLRLWSRQEQFTLLPHDVPEILSVDLASLALEVALWGAKGPEQLKWLDPPRSGQYRQAKKLLISIGAMTGPGGITDLGRKLIQFPLHPRLAHMLLKAKNIAQVALACDIAAVLTERDILTAESSASVDLEIRVKLLDNWREGGDRALLARRADLAACKRIVRLADQWSRQAGGEKGRKDYTEIGNLLVYAYPDRIARHRGEQGGSYQLSSGKGAALPPGDLLATSEYLVVPQLDGGKTDARIYLAAPLDLTELKKQHKELFSFDDCVSWDTLKRKVSAVRRQQLGKIVVGETVFTAVDPLEIKRALRDGIRQMGASCLPWSEKARQYQLRICYLRRLRPELQLPDLSEEILLRNLDWLDPYLGGLTSAAGLKKIDLKQIFRSMLSWEQQQAVDVDTPEKLAVPSGSKIRLTYSLDNPPFLAVKLQEMFGAKQTPAICRGQVAVVLHLLSPAQRPIQITSDIFRFWGSSYPEVKKELKGRYPKHYWPEDPLSAKASRSTLRRKKPAR